MERFESQALAIMREYRGELLTAFEVQPSDGQGDAEVKRMARASRREIWRLNA